MDKGIKGQKAKGQREKEIEGQLYVWMKRRSDIEAKGQSDKVSKGRVVNSGAKEPLEKDAV